jgi:hypothetical protein
VDNSCQLFFIFERNQQVGGNGFPRAPRDHGAGAIFPRLAGSNRGESVIDEKMGAGDKV